MQKDHYTLIDHLLTIPEAQIKIFDLEWQSAFYTVFHQTRASRLLHAFCMAPIVFSLFTLASYWNIGGAHIIESLPHLTAVNGAFIVLIVLTLWYLIMDSTIGMATFPILIGFWGLANGFNYSFGTEGWYIALGLLFTFSFFQTISHQPEPVPPPHSGTQSFLSYREWNKTASFGNKTKVIALLPIFVMIELISSPRLLPIQMLRLFHKFGYKPELLKRTEEGAKRVLASGDYNAY